MEGLIGILVTKDVEVQLICYTEDVDAECGRNFGEEEYRRIYVGVNIGFVLLLFVTAEAQIQSLP